MEGAIYVLVRSDLEIPAGKLAVQVSHACCSVLWAMARSHPQDWWRAHAYMEESQKKVVLRASLAEIERVREEARSLGQTAVEIVDEGRTVFPEPTLTCIGIGIIAADERGPRLKRARLY